LCDRNSVEESKRRQIEDICVAEPLLKNVAVLHNAEAYRNYRKFSLC